MGFRSCAEIGPEMTAPSRFDLSNRVTLITGGAGLLGLAPSIWMITDGLPRARINPTAPMVGVAGRF